jgi:hypothetical protein
MNDFTLDYEVSKVHPSIQPARDVPGFKEGMP